MKARLIRHEKVVDERGNIVEIKMWQLQKSNPDKTAGYKYSLVYIVNDKRVIGYDNSEGKGDHRHIRRREELYRFESLRKLARDFFEDIERYKRGEL